MCLGYISAYSETLALAVIMAKGVQPIIDRLSKDEDQNVQVKNDINGLCNPTLYSFQVSSG